MAKYRIKIISIFLIVAFNFLCSYNANATQHRSNKILIIALDQLDLSMCEDIMSHNLSLGLMSIKNPEIYKRVNAESLFMTMSTGRRVKLDKGSYSGIKEGDNNYIFIEDYENIVKDLNKKNKNLPMEIDLLGDSLAKNNVNTGVLGVGSSAMLIADREGIIQNGFKEIKYDEKWLKSTTEELFKAVDLLVVSYNIHGQKDRINILKSYIEEFNHLYIFVFPENINGDILYKFNTTLVPLIYSDGRGEGGILTSNTTRREGLITNLDIRPTIEYIYGIKSKGAIGNKIGVIKGTNIIEENKNNLLEFLNLNIIKYAFHGYVIAAQLYVIYNCALRGRKDYKKYNMIMMSILLCILLSLIAGIFNIHRYIVIYLGTIIFTSIFISRFLINKGLIPLSTISIGTNILILVGAFFNMDIIYNSFIGYNNIIAGGRFYGFNNEIMGVLLATSIITVYRLKKIIRNWAVLYFLISILALSGKYGANVGGYITSILGFLILIYTNLFNKKKGMKSFIALSALGISALALNLYFDIHNGTVSHGGGLMQRIKIFGIYELYNMIAIKLKQLLTISILPPWNIILCGQTYFIIRFFKDNRGFLRSIDKTGIESPDKYGIIFIISLIAFVTNDTGIVAFTYINTYLIAYILNAYRVKKSLDGDD
ncbi:MAG: hypothetical protein EWM50_02995 [Gottschalkiaceae bacterium]|nr:MAG: hypothetical protein EWM50_02995 [Gottschalkiaceae bacterium]